MEWVGWMETGYVHSNAKSKEGLPWEFIWAGQDRVVRIQEIMEGWELLSGFL